MKRKRMKFDVVFHVAYPYYYPHFLPIGKALEQEGLNVFYILSDKQNKPLMEEIAKEEGLAYEFGEYKLSTVDTKVIIFAKILEEHLQTQAKQVFLCHGTGTKQCGFAEAFERYDIVLVEGSYRYEKYMGEFSQYSHKIKKVGYSKLDPVVNISAEEKKDIQNKYALDTSKKTILYAPTFFPSSIEKMPDTFPSDFKECNILVKPHYLSWERKRYKKQRQKFENWMQHDNCTVLGVGEYNLIPFMMISDVMISDESSAIFEFASLNKPVIINRFLKLRWSYYLSPKKLFKRMDGSMDRYRVVGENPSSYDEMLEATKRALSDSGIFEDARLSLAHDVCGVVDGKVSIRIVEVIKDLNNE